MIMNGRKWLMIGLFSMMLMLALVFSCDNDLGTPAETTEETGDVNAPPAQHIPTAAALPVLSDMASRNYTASDSPETLSVRVINASQMATLSFEWYSNTGLSASGGTPIVEGVTESEDGTATSFTPPVNETDTFYYVKVTNTDESKEIKTSSRTSNIARIRFNSAEAGTAKYTITVNNGTTYQYVRGFGGMSSAWTSPEVTLKDVDTMFSPDGLGYNIFRIMIYPYMDNLFNGKEPAPVNSPNAHRNYYNMVRQAKSYGALLLASPWTPPGEWKTNGTRLTGKLKEEHWGDYARHLRDYIERMERNSVAINYISTQNEPDIAVSYDGCEWTGEEMRDFIKAYGAYITPGNDPVKLMPGESFQFRDPYYSPIYNDTAAMEATGVIGGHIYGGGLSRKTRAIQAGKEVWMTEHLFNTESNYDIDSQWQMVWNVVQELHECMAADFNAYVWWYAKRFYSLIGDGEYGTVDGRPLFRGYALSHYAKYATGKTRIAATGRVNGSSVSGANVFVTAYESDDEITVVLYNRPNSTGSDKSLIYNGTANAMGQVNINLPVAVKGASMVITQGGTSSEGGRQNDTLASGIKVMAPEIIALSADGRTGTLDLPASSIVSVRFTK